MEELVRDLKKENSDTEVTYKNNDLQQTELIHDVFVRW
jgi:hypothetical protein